MLFRLSVLGGTAFVLLVPQEPAPRRLDALLARFDGDLNAISGVRELPEGRVLLSDFREPAVYLLDLRTGTSTRIGRDGSGPNEYRQPGGIYPGRGDTSMVLDRSQHRILLVTRDGRIGGMRSVGVQGTSSSSDLDVDRTRLDASGTPYFTDPSAVFGTRRGVALDSIALWRFDPDRQHADTVAVLRLPETRIISAEANVVRSQRVLFSPADGWGVASDGRVAVVRAMPFRVEWYDPSGRVTRGPEVSFVAVPVTDQDREAVADQRQSTGIGARGAQPTSFRGSAPLFSRTKPAFDPDDIIVAPHGHVWVGREEAADALHALYDVFDGRGARVDRVALPARSRVVGFGTGAVYVSERDADDVPRLRKYAFTDDDAGTRRR